MQYAAVEGHLGENYVAEVNSDRDIEFIQERDLATVEFVEDYEEQESGYNIKWN